LPTFPFVTIDLTVEVRVAIDAIEMAAAIAKKIILKL
jgi:hypothetical protein